MKAKIPVLFCSVLFSFSVMAATAFYSHEEVSGLNKICYYTSAAGTHAKTIPAHRICPGSIEV